MTTLFRWVGCDYSPQPNNISSIRPSPYKTRTSSRHLIFPHRKTTTSPESIVSCKIETLVDMQFSYYMCLLFLFLFVFSFTYHHVDAASLSLSPPPSLSLSNTFQVSLPTLQTVWLEYHSCTCVLVTSFPITCS